MSHHRPKALIVDLDETVLIRLERVLENEGIDTDTSWDPDQACHELATGKYDLLLVEHHPPQIDAHQALQCPSRVPFIVLLPRATHPFEPQYWQSAGAAAALPMWAVDDILVSVKKCLATSAGIPSGPVPSSGGKKAAG